MNRGFSINLYVETSLRYLCSIFKQLPQADSSAISMATTHHGSTFDGMLVEAVKEWPVLYNVLHPDYHVSQVKNMAWNAILQKLTDMGFKCKDIIALMKRWRYLRDYYRKIKKDIETKARSGSQTYVIKWPYFTSISFLEDHSHKQNCILSTSENLQDLLNHPASPIGSETAIESCTSTSRNLTSVPCVVELKDEDEADHKDHVEMSDHMDSSEDCSSPALRRPRYNDKWERRAVDEIMECIQSTSKLVHSLDFSLQPENQLNRKSKESKEEVFGRFVTQMLLEMDEEKKKMTIREITNILMS